MGELLARLRAAMRQRSHAAEPPPAVIKTGALTIDFPRRLVSRAGEIVHLSPKEYDLLAKLALNAGKVMQHRDLLIAIWGPAHVDDTQYLRVFVGQLRQKIENDPAEPQLILTEPGIGYRSSPTTCCGSRRSREARAFVPPAGASGKGAQMSVVASFVYGDGERIREVAVEAAENLELRAGEFVWIGLADPTQRSSAPCRTGSTCTRWPSRTPSGPTSCQRSTSTANSSSS